MKRIISAALVLVMLFALAGCDLFSKADVVKLGDYSHTDPKGVKYDERIVLKNENFGQMLATSASSEAYPDTTVYDEDGNPIGMYIYDETTGLASGWSNFTDGSVTTFEEGSEVDLGKPDESKIVTFKGDVKLYFVIYGNEKKANYAYMYLFLSDKADKDSVLENVKNIFQLDFTAESDTVLVLVEDEKVIDNDFDSAKDYGLDVSDKSAAGYAEILKDLYQASEDKGDVAYEPYAKHEDPTDLDYDTKIVLTGSAEYAVQEDYIDDVTNISEFIYGKDGKVVAEYMYVECKDAATAQKLLDDNQFMTGAKIVNDSVVLTTLRDQTLTDLIEAYKGYNILKDDSLDAYVENDKGTYMTTEVK